MLLQSQKHGTRRGLHEIEEHHTLMQGRSFRRFWERRGISAEDIENSVIRLPTDIHRAIEESGWWQDNLLERIASREAELGRLLNRGEVMNIVNDLLWDLASWAVG